jgi:hypothetical protein
MTMHYSFDVFSSCCYTKDDVGFIVVVVDMWKELSIHEVKFTVSDLFIVDLAQTTSLCSKLLVDSSVQMPKT